MQRTMVFAYIQRPGFFLQGVFAVQGLGFRIAGTPQSLNPQAVAKWAQAFRGSLWSGAISPPPPWVNNTEKGYGSISAFSFRQ